MLKQLLIFSVIVGQLCADSPSAATLSPDLAKYLPKDLPTLPERHIVCFNKYWQIKEQLERELRRVWNCSQVCHRGAECCLSYKVWDSLSTLVLEECDREARSMIQMFLPMAYKQISSRCAPDFQHESDQCREIEASLGARPLSGEDSCGRKVCACY